MAVAAVQLLSAVQQHRRPAAVAATVYRVQSPAQRSTMAAEVPVVWDITGLMAPEDSVAAVTEAKVLRIPPSASQPVGAVVVPVVALHLTAQVAAGLSLSGMQHRHNR